jgi:hypothetical protein
MAIAAIADLPFRQRPLRELLHVEEHRPGVDLDYAGHGHAQAAAVVLASRDGQRRVVTDALLVGVHHDDDGEPIADDLELAFEIGPVDDPAAAAPYVVPVRLSDFLRVWLPRIRGDERAIVLVTCNPFRARLSRPPAAGATPVYYPVGDVDSWLDEDLDQRRVFRLVAEDWRTAE